MDKKQKTKRGSSGPRAVGTAVSRVARPILGKRGFADASILSHWEELVGPTMAAHACPMKVAFPKGKRSGGTLYLKVEGGSFAMELQHLEPQLLEKINRFFGYAAITNVRMSQGPLPPKKNVMIEELPALNAQEEAALEETLDPIDNGDLKDSLAALGRAIRGRDKKDEDSA